jgi:hypothetical protein
VAVRRPPIRQEAGGRLGGTEESLRRRHVATVTYHRVDQVAVPVNRPIQVNPLASDLQTRLVEVSTGAGLGPPPMPALAQFISHDRQQLRLPVPDGLMTNRDAAERQDFTPVTQGEPIAQAAEHRERDDVTPAARLGKHVRFRTPALRSLNCHPQPRHRNRR